MWTIVICHELRYGYIVRISPGYRRHLQGDLIPRISLLCLRIISYLRNPGKCSLGVYCYILFWMLVIYPAVLSYHLANPDVVIKHQKGGD